MDMDFTSDEDFEFLEDQDPTTCIIGYVDSVSAPTPSGKSNNGMLFKFTISNGSKRITILIWDSLIDKYSKEICSGRVVSINGGFCRAISLSKFKKENHFVPFEIIVREHTSVSYLGYHNLGKQKTNGNLKKATFDDIHTLNGLVEIAGYIRTKFDYSYNRSGLKTHAIGAITNGIKKVNIQVKEFQKSSLEIGDYVTVTGMIKEEDSIVTIFCNSMSDITHDPEINSLSVQAVQKGGRPVKRTHDGKIK